MLSMFVNDREDDWDDHLDFVMIWYRSTVHESTNCSPNSLMFGDEIQCPLDLMVESPPDADREPKCPVEFVQWVKDSLQNAFVFVSENLQRAAERQKRYYDRKSKFHKFKKGDWVWYYYPPRSRTKFGSPWTGPYLIVDVPADYQYVIQETSRSKKRRIHGDYLKECYFDPDEMPKSWIPSDDKQVKHDSNVNDMNSDDTVATEIPGDIPVAEETPAEAPAADQSSDQSGDRSAPIPTAPRRSKRIGKKPDRLSYS